VQFRRSQSTILASRAPKLGVGPDSKRQLTSSPFLVRLSSSIPKSGIKLVRWSPRISAFRNEHALSYPHCYPQITPVITAATQRMSVDSVNNPVSNMHTQASVLFATLKAAGTIKRNPSVPGLRGDRNINAFLTVSQLGFAPRALSQRFWPKAAFRAVHRFRKTPATSWSMHSAS
jgi:hypothetical protein